MHQSAPTQLWSLLPPPVQALSINVHPAEPEGKASVSQRALRGRSRSQGDSWSLEAESPLHSFLLLLLQPGQSLGPMAVEFPVLMTLGDWIEWGWEGGRQSHWLESLKMED